MNPICICRAIYRSVLAQALVSGHDYETGNESTPANVHVLRCRMCGYVSVGWSWHSLEGEK